MDRGRRRSYALVIVLLGALWGSSYLFIKVAVREWEPSTMTMVRLLIAGPLLLAVPVTRVGVAGARRELLAAWRPLLVLACLNVAAPYVLIAWGETHIDSGVAAVANSTPALFVAILAPRFFPSERVTGVRIVGLLAGLGGVALLAGVQPEGGGWAVLGTLAVVLASLSYAVAALFAQARVQRIHTDVLLSGSILVGALLLVPPGLAQLPSEAPGWKSTLSIVALAVFGTVAGLLLYYRLIAEFGSGRALLVGYVYPLFAVLYGALLLDEPVSAAMLGGMALILAGVAVGSGALRRPTRSPPTAVPLS
jgi:drug/metabolite transporter (DMT)-like permease